eukprot:scaffold16412_cov59-Phaeocystis_antarctica.AAC.7
MDLIRCHRLGFFSGSVGFSSLLGVLAKKRPADTGAGQRSGGCSGRRARGVRGRRQARSARVERRSMALGRGARRRGARREAQADVSSIYNKRYHLYAFISIEI